MAAMVSTGPMPKAIEAEFHISMQAAFTACGNSCPPQSAGAAVPAGGGPRSVGVFPARRRRDLAILEWRPELVADTVKRRDHIAGKTPGFGQHRVHRFLVEVA